MKGPMALLENLKDTLRPSVTKELYGYNFISTKPTWSHTCRHTPECTYAPTSFKRRFSDGARYTPVLEARVLGPAGMAAIITAERFASMEFDYIIIGGGTAGLVLATRYICPEISTYQYIDDLNLPDSLRMLPPQLV